MSDNTYDSTNEVWPFFVLTVLGCVLVPVTLSTFVSLMVRAPTSKCSPAHAKFRASKQTRNTLFSRRTLLLAVGWAVMGYLIFFVQNVQSSSPQQSVWDPYEILGVSTSATVREIRSAYRKLSLTMHPDKLKDVGEGGEENSAYVEVVKAYRALTDEQTRENFLMHGHPDGPQPVSHGIALPSFLFDSNASILVMALYLLGFGFGVPFVVSKWWKHSQQRTKNGLLKSTAGQLLHFTVKNRPQFVTNDEILELVLSTPDLQQFHSGGRSPMELLREYLEGGEQTHEMLSLVSEVERVLTAYLDIAASAQIYGLCEKIVKLIRSIVQPTTGKPAPTTPKELENFRFLSAEFKVANESVITPGSKVFLELKYATADATKEDLKSLDDQLNKFTATQDVSGYNKTQPELPEIDFERFPMAKQNKWLVFMYHEQVGNLTEKPIELKNMDLQSKAGVLTVPVNMNTPTELGKFSMLVAVLNPYLYNCDLKTRVTMQVEADRLQKKTENEVENDDLSESEESDSDSEVEGPSDIDTSTDEE